MSWQSKIQKKFKAGLFTMVLGLTILFFLFSVLFNDLSFSVTFAGVAPSFCPLNKAGAKVNFYLPVSVFSSLASPDFSGYQLSCLDRSFPRPSLQPYRITKKYLLGSWELYLVISFQHPKIKMNKIKIIIIKPLLLPYFY